MQTLNLIGYSVYLPATIYITVYVGKALFKHGHLFLLDTFHGEADMARVCNRFLLTGYYLINLGYAVASINLWGEIIQWKDLIDELGTRLGSLILGLGIVHYFNLYWLTKFSERIKSLYHNMSKQSIQKL